MSEERSRETTMVDVVRAIQPYDAADLLASIGALQLLSENAEREIRLDFIAQAASSLECGEGKPRMSLRALRKICNSDLFADAMRMEDPAENPFTECVTFFGGTYIVLPGITEDGAYVVSLLGRAVFLRNPDLARSRFGREAYGLLAGALALSDEVARRAGLRRGMEPGHDSRQRVLVPAAEKMKALKAAVVFTEAELAEVLKPLDIELDVLEPLVSQCGSRQADEFEVSPSTVNLKPLIRTGEAIIVVEPTSIVFAVRHHLIRLASEMSVIDDLAASFSEAVWQDVVRALGFLGNNQLRVRLTGSAQMPCFHEGVFNLDTDKVVYVALVTDSLAEFVDEPLGKWPSHGLADLLEERAREVERSVMTGDSQLNVVLNLFVFQAMGRAFVAGFGAPPPPLQSPRLVITASELGVIAGVEGGDQLLLLKYAEAGEALRERTKVVAFSQLDEFYLYRSKDRSYHVSADATPDLLSVGPGTGTELRLENIRRRDWHAVRSFERDHLVEVRCLHGDVRVPIYVSPDHFGRAVALCVEAFPVPVWVVANEDQSVLGMQQQLCEMVAFWLWQFAPELAEPLAALEERGLPLVIRLTLEDVQTWTMEEGPPPEVPADIKDVLRCEVARDRYEIEIHIRPGARGLFIGPDNEGERRFMRAALAAVRALVEQVDTESSQGLSDARINDVLDRHAPLGAKKMILIYDLRSEPELDRQGLPRRRLVQQADVSMLSDEIGAALSGQGLSAGAVKDADRKAVLRDIVTFLYRELQQLVVTIRGDELLDQLVAMNESLAEGNASLNLTIATRQACYGEFYDIVEAVMKEQVGLNTAALASRFIIEYVAARPGDGPRPVSLVAYDRLQALGDLIVSWAFVGDIVHFGIADPKIEMTRSGRIQMNMAEYEEGRQAYMKQALFPGHVRQSIETHRGRWKPRDSGDQPAAVEELDEAARDEFGLSLTDIVVLETEIMNIGYQLAEPTKVMQQEVLLNQLRDRLSWNESDVQRGLKFLGLAPRDDFLDPPPPFRPEDVYPWRFNRALSYIRKPIVLRMRGDDWEVVWGNRHLHVAAQHLVNLCVYGRLKAQSKRMKAYISRSLNAAALEFNERVADAYAGKSGVYVKRRVRKIAGELIGGAATPLGDIDVLVADRRRKEVLAIECKDLALARTPRELATEIERLFEGRGDRESAAERQLKRAKWLGERLDKVLLELGIMRKGRWRVKPSIVLDDEPMSFWIRSSPLPVKSLARVRQEIEGEGVR